MCDLYIQTNDSVAGYWFTGDLDAHVNDTLTIVTVDALTIVTVDALTIVTVDALTIVTVDALTIVTIF